MLDGFYTSATHQIQLPIDANGGTFVATCTGVCGFKGLPFSIAVHRNTACRTPLSAPTIFAMPFIFLKRLKISIQPLETEKDYGDKGVPQHVADNIVEGLKLIKQSERGEIKLENAYDLLKELRGQPYKTN